MIPDPWSVISGGAGAVAGWSWDQVAAGIARWVLEALAAPIDGVLNFLKTSARPNMTASWFAGSDSPFVAVRNLGAVLLARDRADFDVLHEDAPKTARHCGTPCEVDGCAGRDGRTLSRGRAPRGPRHR